LVIQTKTEQKSFGSAIQRSFLDVGKSLGPHGAAILMNRRSSTFGNFHFQAHYRYPSCQYETKVMETILANY
jgi:hypothetical protein